ncbi:MAG: LacI family DNA-binding transcriptional regulator [Lachnospiraceae bacterium]
MGQKKDVKLDDIAKRLNVSIVTVSNALKGKKGVSDQMRKQILEMAEEMGYEVTKERKPVETVSYMIGVVVAERYVKEFPSFYMDIYKWTAKEIAKRGSLTVLEIVENKKESDSTQVELFSGVHVDGVIVIGQLNQKVFHYLKEKFMVPIVCVDYYDVDEDIDYIVTDGYGGTEQIMEMLIQQGFRQFCFVGNPKATRNIMDRYMGYCKALEKYELNEQQSYVLKDRGDQEYCYQLEVPVPERIPEVFVCNCDKAAKILVENLAEQGYQVPEDVSVTGFDNYYPQLHTGLCLTTYENDEKTIAQISVNTMFRRIGGREAGGIRIVEGHIVYGDTVKKLTGR